VPGYLAQCLDRSPGLWNDIWNKDRVDGEDPSEGIRATSAVVSAKAADGQVRSRAKQSTIADSIGP
jgi:hypothetical protein